MFRSPSPTMALMVSASRMKGKDSCTSTSRMSTAPGQPLEVAGEEAEDAAHHRGEQHRAEPDEERDAGAVEHPREEIAAELVGARGMPRRARRLEALARSRRLQRIVGRQQRRREGGQDGDAGQDQADDAQSEDAEARGALDG